MKAFVLTLLHVQRGQAADNFQRARAAFRGYTENQLNQQYGENDETVKEVLQQYADELLRIERAINWIEARK